MIIEKIAVNKDNFKIYEYYYNSAREGMLDLFSNMVREGLINTILLPGYIGWSPNEGSGIFDPIKKLEGISVQYYKMTSDLSIDFNDLQYKIQKLQNGNIAVLIINYFGFIDVHVKEVFEMVKRNSGWIITDNAHGFFTYQCSEDIYSDATFFSLHKMFPFKSGGSLIVKNKMLKNLRYRGSNIYDTEYNPWIYDVKKIAKIRLENYGILEDVITKGGNLKYFAPLKTNVMEGNIPQTFPIRINIGNRNKIYGLMNEVGYGVVSLYHTLIEPLLSTEFKTSLDLSRCIMNLPVHQDVDTSQYKNMIEFLIKCCQRTGNE